MKNNNFIQWGNLVSSTVYIPKYSHNIQHHVRYIVRSYQILHQRESLPVCSTWSVQQEPILVRPVYYPLSSNELCRCRTLDDHVCSGQPESIWLAFNSVAFDFLHLDWVVDTLPNAPYKFVPKNYTVGHGTVLQDVPKPRSSWASVVRGRPRLIASLIIFQTNVTGEFLRVARLEYSTCFLNSKLITWRYGYWHPNTIMYGNIFIVIFC